MKIPAKGFTHGGKFHADDVFSTALLQILRPDIQITRGFVVPDGFDGIVYDVGGGCWARSWSGSIRPACWMKTSSSRWI